jgi:hypothetical protein
MLALPWLWYVCLQELPNDGLPSFGRKENVPVQILETGLTGPLPAEMTALFTTDSLGNRALSSSLYPGGDPDFHTAVASAEQQLKLKLQHNYTMIGDIPIPTRDELLGVATTIAGFDRLSTQLFWPKMSEAVGKISGPVVMMLCNKAAFVMLENFLCSVAKMGVLSSVLVWAVDKYTTNQLKLLWPGVGIFDYQPFLQLNSTVAEKEAPFSSANYISFALAKMLMPFACAALEVECVVQDTDIVWRSNLLPYLSQLGRAGAY